MAQRWCHRPIAIAPELGGGKPHTRYTRLAAAWSKHSGGLKWKPVSVIFGQLITQEQIRGLGEGREAYPLIGELIMNRIAELKEKFEKGLINE